MMAMVEMAMKEQTMAMAEMMKGEAIPDNMMADSMMVVVAMKAEAKYHLSHKQLIFSSFLWLCSLDGCSCCRRSKIYGYGHGCGCGC